MCTKLFLIKLPSHLLYSKNDGWLLMEQGIVSTHENLPTKIATNTEATIIQMFYHISGNFDEGKV